MVNDLSVERLADRKHLLASFDHFRRDVDGSGLMEGLDAFQQQAFGVLTSSKLAAALEPADAAGDPAAHAAALTRYSIGCLHAYAHSGFSRKPSEALSGHWRYIG